MKYTLDGFLIFLNILNVTLYYLFPSAAQSRIGIAFHVYWKLFRPMCCPRLKDIAIEYTHGNNYRVTIVFVFFSIRLGCLNHLSVSDHGFTSTSCGEDEQNGMCIDTEVGVCTLRTL